MKLRYAVENHRGGALLAGPSGSGKTLVVGDAPATAGRADTPLVHVVFPQMSTEELLAYLAAKLGGSGGGSARRRAWPEHPSRSSGAWPRCAERGQPPVVVIDEAHLLDDRRTLEALRLLLNFEIAGRPAMTLCWPASRASCPSWTACPRSKSGWRSSACCVRFTPAETAEYVAHRLRVAGAERTIFEPDALERSTS